MQAIRAAALATDRPERPFSREGSRTRAPCRRPRQEQSCQPRAGVSPACAIQFDPIIRRERVAAPKGRGHLTQNQGETSFRYPRIWPGTTTCAGARLRSNCCWPACRYFRFAIVSEWATIRELADSVNECDAYPTQTSVVRRAVIASNRSFIPASSGRFQTDGCSNLVECQRFSGGAWDRCLRRQATEASICWKRGWSRMLASSGSRRNQSSSKDKESPTPHPGWPSSAKLRHALKSLDYPSAQYLPSQVGFFRRNLPASYRTYSTASSGLSTPFFPFLVENQ